MRWNLRMAAARRDIWKASQMQRLLAEHGLVISAGKMSGLWSGTPSSIKLSDLDVICAVLDCDAGELLIAEPHAVHLPPGQPAPQAAASSPAPPGTSPVTPRRRDGRSLPPP